MGKSPSYFIVESSALPEIFLKVAEAKRLLETGEVDTVHLATLGHPAGGHQPQRIL